MFMRATGGNMFCLLACAKNPGSFTLINVFISMFRDLFMFCRIHCNLCLHKPSGGHIPKCDATTTLRPHGGYIFS